MPIYTVKCPSCNESYEIFKKMSEAYPSKCKLCGKKVSLARDFAADNLSLKIPEHMKATGSERPNYAKRGKELEVPKGMI